MVCVNLVDRTVEVIEAVKNEELLGTVYYDMSNNGVERRMKEHMKRLKGEL